MKPSFTTHKVGNLPAVLACVIGGLLLAGCGKSDSPATTAPAVPGQVKTIGVAFETLQTEFWVAAFDKLKADCAAASGCAAPSR